MLSRTVALGCLLTAGPALAAPPAVDDHPASSSESERDYLRRYRIFVAGLAMFGGAAGGAAVGFGMAAHDFQKWGPLLDARLADIKARGGRTPADDFFLEQADFFLDTARATVIWSSAIAVVFVGVGAGLVAHSRRQGPVFRRARLVPTGGPQGAGLSLIGRF